MNFEIEKLKNMLIATREKNGGWVCDWCGCLPVGSGQAQLGGGGSTGRWWCSRRQRLLGVAAGCSTTLCV